MPSYISIKNRSEDERPREKLMAHGPKTLSNAELLGILINTGTRQKSAVDLARELLNHSNNNLNQLARLSAKELCKIDGIGPAKAITIMSAIELGGRRNAESVQKGQQITTSKDAYGLMAHQLGHKKYEEFWIILLNRSNRLIRDYCVSEGSATGTVADPKKIYKVAIDEGACGIILCHNHPSGNLTPSQADIKLTQKIKDAGDMLDIAVLDHIIVAHTGYYSFADEGRM
jgi:DNA repair protein RadC